MSATAEYHRKRRAGLRRAGLCIECCRSRKARNGKPMKGATTIRCSRCAERHRGYYRKIRALKPKPVQVPIMSAVDQLVALASKFPPSRITRADLDRRKPVNL